MSMCRVFSCVVGSGCLLWPVCSLGKTLLAFALLHSVLQGQICLYSRYLFTSYFCIPVPYNEKDIFFWVLVLKCLVGLHRTVQLQLLQCYWLGHRLGLPWYWIVCLVNEERSFCHFWDCIQVLHFTAIYKIDHQSYSQSRQWHPTPVLFSGKSHGWRSLVGCSPWGR